MISTIGLGTNCPFCNVHRQPMINKRWLLLILLLVVWFTFRWVSCPFSALFYGQWGFPCVAEFPRLPRQLASYWVGQRQALAGYLQVARRKETQGISSFLSIQVAFGARAVYPLWPQLFPDRSIMVLALLSSPELW